MLRRGIQLFGVCRDHKIRAIFCKLVKINNGHIMRFNQYGMHMADHASDTIERELKAFSI